MVDLTVTLSIDREKESGLTRPKDQVGGTRLC